jgi:hypothetical protein
MRAVSSAFGVFALFLAVVTPTSGRLIDIWPYERLFNEADLVVIASAEGTKETNDMFKAEGWKLTLVGQQTTFSTRAILKGDLKETKRIEVLHYRLPDGQMTRNGPWLVSFWHEKQRLSGTINGEAFKAVREIEYLLFLRLRQDGRFEAVSGQVDPALSVKELTSLGYGLSKLGQK